MASTCLITIEPIKKHGLGLRHLVKSVWKYRQLLAFLSWRDILIRYKRTLLGFSWLIIRPVLSVVILTFVFNRLAKLSSGPVNYLSFVLSGYLFWQFFSTYLSDAGNSLLVNSSLITKVYFPRILLPLSCLASGVIDYIAALFLLFLVFIFTGTPFIINLWLIPLAFLWVCLLSTAIAMIYAPLVAKHRDLRYALPFFLQILMFLSPVGYSQNLIKGGLVFWYYLNPLAGIISFGRWIFFNEYLSFAVLISAGVTLFIFFAAVFYFQRQSSNLADTL